MPVSGVMVESLKTIACVALLKLPPLVEV